MNVQATINLKHNSTVRELKEAMEKVPDTARITIRHYTGDRPGESSYSTITFTWSI